jgi:DNA-binding NarL/FixJ family response regulator
MRVLVAAGETVASGVAGMLEDVPGVELVGTASPDDTVAEVARLDPDVVVIQLTAGDDQGPALIEELRRRHVGLPVLALLEGVAADEAVIAGADGVLPASASTATVAAALGVVGQGLTVMPRDELARILAPDQAPDNGDLPVERLTDRESQVLQLLAAGMTNAEIAARLGISAHTAKFHVGAVLGKLGARSRADAVARASRLGWIVV